MTDMLKTVYRHYTPLKFLFAGGITNFFHITSAITIFSTTAGIISKILINSGEPQLKSGSPCTFEKPTAKGQRHFI